MKFSLKLVLCTMIVMAAAFGFSGFYFVNYVFERALNREIEQGLSENDILKFAFETAALNVPAKYDVLQDDTTRQIASGLEAGGRDTVRMLRISDEEKRALYVSDGFPADGLLLAEAGENKKTYRVLRLEDGFYIQTAAAVEALDRSLYLETLRDVSEVFYDRNRGFAVYRRVTVFLLLLGTLLMHFISAWLTRPIRLLTRATKRMAAGDYDYRARQVSDDELGQLTTDFNRMANALEDNIIKLEEEIRAREDFVAAFAHELKTPLTAIIGYADMLRSHRLDEEKSFMSANYIYTEGRRLETMSLRLLDIIVTKRQGLKQRAVLAESLFYYLYDMYAANKNMEFHFTYDKGQVWCDPDLIKSVLINLLDNACKASEPGSPIEVDGYLLPEGYRFSVTDHGAGIPEEEIYKITKPFYMVDKSRSRSRNGAGLGLALCSEILLLHRSSLEITSRVGEGSCFSFLLPGSGGGRPKTESPGGKPNENGALSQEGGDTK